MVAVLRNDFVGLASIPVGFSRVKSRLICLSSSPRKLSCSSISRLLRRSVSKCRRRSLRVPKT
jgi:hypothetical protein